MVDTFGVFAMDGDGEAGGTVDLLCLVDGLFRGIAVAVSCNLDPSSNTTGRVCRILGRRYALDLRCALYHLMGPLWTPALSCLYGRC